VYRIVRKDLRLKCFKKRRAQELTAANRDARLTRAKKLLRLYPQSAVNFIFFSDEKMFTVAPPVNLQNDRVYVPQSSKKRDVAADRLLRTRPTFSKSLMVSVAVSKLGCTELIFVQPGAKVNGAYYRDELLAKHMLPAIRQIAGDHFIFQQDSAPAHRARLHSRDASRLNCLHGAIPIALSASDFPFRLLVDAVTHVLSVFRVCKVP